MSKERQATAAEFMGLKPYPERDAPATPKPRAGEHTKGGWQTNGLGGVFGGAATGLIAQVTRTANPDVMAADARRIVACVNACEGYPTEFLERGGLRSGIKGGAQSEDALRSRNAELVEILSGCLDSQECNGYIGVALAEEVRALLAKAPT